MWAQILPWIMSNWQWALPTAILVADQVVKITPNKKDDLVLSTTKAILSPVLPAAVAAKIGVNKS